MGSKEIHQFPTLKREANGHRLVYLDSAATTQKPYSVLKAVEDYYRDHNANPHRGAYGLSMEATSLYEKARTAVKDFIGAGNEKEIIFTKNATEALNLVAYSYGMAFIERGDEIVISIAEHHSNLIPWQQVARAKGAILKYLYLDDDGMIPEEEIQKKITNKTKMVSITQVSNALGIIYPVEEIIRKAHSVGAVAVVDASQSIPHMAINVTTMEADFVAFSGHKMLAPMGIGVLYGREELLEKMPPFLCGGEMIEYVWEQEATYAQLPYKFEGGTQNVGGAVGLMAAIEYLNNFGMERVEQIEKELIQYSLEKLSQIPHLTIYGTKDIMHKSGAIAFNIDDVHPHDTATILDAYGVAIRAGHHCAEPLMRYMNVNATCRASFYLYNTIEDIDIFAEAVANTRKWLIGA